MDKETLSKYGWVVMVIIILVILMSFAAPFGNYFYDSTMKMVETLNNATNIEQLFGGAGGESGGNTDDGTGEQPDVPEVVTDYTVEQINADATMFMIGATKPEYVVANFNNAFTEVVITKNGDDSDGLMMDWTASTALAQQAVYLKTAIVQKGVASLGTYTFYNCKQLNSITVFDSLVSVGESALFNISNNSKVYCESQAVADLFVDNLNYKSTSTTEIVVVNSNKTITNYTAEEIDSNELLFPIGKTNKYYVVAKLNEDMTKVTVTKNGYNSDGIMKDFTSGSFLGDIDTVITADIKEGVTVIGAGAFGYRYNLTNVIIPDSVTTINNNAFRKCSNLTGTITANNMAVVGDYAFSEAGITGVNMPNAVTLGNSVFRACTSLEFVNIPNINALDSYAFYDCSKLKSVTLSDSMEEFGEYLFTNCSGLEHIAIPNGVVNLGQYLFQNCISLKTVILPDGLKTIDYRAFLDCKNLLEIILPNTVTSIGNEAFSGCTNLETLVLSNSITEISEEAFRYTKISTLVIPASVTNIESNAFGHCNNLKQVTFKGTNLLDIDSKAFYACPIDTVYGYVNSPAEAFANNRGVDFIEL